MIMSLSAFKPKHRFLVCVDSDGCAIDSMEIKHRNCFGPAVVAEWGLEAIEEAFLARWNEINLYSVTRGINRFKGLAMIAEEFDISGWQEMKLWTQRTKALSNDTLILETDAALKKMLNWSYRVNEAIEALPLPKPFSGVREMLELMGSEADIAVVSSANLIAIKQEWGAGSLLGYVSVLLSQNDGSKSSCIARLLQKGYNRANVLMIGDAPSDYQAAIENDVSFYPINPGKEADSWRILKDRAWHEFKSGWMDSSYLSDFNRNLGI